MAVKRPLHCSLLRSTLLPLSKMSPLEAPNFEWSVMEPAGTYAKLKIAWNGKKKRHLIFGCKQGLLYHGSLVPVQVTPLIYCDLFLLFVPCPYFYIFSRSSFFFSFISLVFISFLVAFRFPSLFLSFLVDKSVHNSNNATGLWDVGDACLGVLD